VTKYVWRNGAWVDTTGMVRRKHVGPFIISDTQEPLQHPVTGEIFDSKSAFRAVTRAHGLEEVGNESPFAATPPEPVGIADDLAAAFQMHEQGYEAPPITEHLGDANWSDARILT
jgi:hypothetical protein